MITLKILKPITNSQTNKLLKKGDLWEVSETRLKEIRANKEIKFDAYFEVMKIEKKVVEPIVEKKTRSKKEK
jgi:hypothetical protein